MTPQMTLGFTGFYSLSGPRPPGGSNKPRKNRCFSIPSGVPRGGVDLNAPQKGVLLGGHFGVILGGPFGGPFWVVFLHKIQLKSQRAYFSSFGTFGPILGPIGDPPASKSKLSPGGRFWVDFWTHFGSVWGLILG